MIYAEDINSIRKDVEKMIGVKLKIKVNGGRLKTSINNGVVLAAYPSIFTFKVEDEGRDNKIISFTYADIISSNITFIKI